MHATVPRPPFVQSLQMAGARVGYAVGGKQTDRVLRLYRTVDGGRSWAVVAGARLQAPPTLLGRHTVLFPARVGGAIVVERSDDGGRTWRASRPLRDGSAAAAPGQVLALDARRLYLALGEGAAAGSSAQSLWRSDDGGRAWRFVSRTRASGRLRGSLPFSCDKTGYGFATPLRGWAGGACAGGRAFLYRTDDGGRSWRPLRLRGLDRCACDVSAPRFFGARAGAFAVDGFPQAGGGPAIARIYWTDDGGVHWRVATPPVGRLGQLTLAGPRTAWVVGAARGSIGSRFDRLYVTTDAGRRWRAARLPFDAHEYRIDAVDARIAYAVGGAGRRTALLRTVDGGRSWRALP